MPQAAYLQGWGIDTTLWRPPATTELEHRVETTPLILVAGMHRSGTSAVTRLLNLLGASLGDVELMEAQPDNPRGFWEAREIVRFNDRLLATLGGSWSAPPDLWEGWASSPALTRFRAEAIDLIAKLRSDGAAIHAVKDPRFSLTLPFWRAIAPDARVVVPLREPVAVAQSLKRRNGMPFAEAGDLWTLYVSNVLHHAPEAVVVPYDELLAHPLDVTSRLVADLRLTGVSDEQVAQAAASIAPEANHAEPAADTTGHAADIYATLMTGTWPTLDPPGTDVPDSRRLQVVLHIGVEGVADVPLSEVLATNRATLAEQGVLYPRSLGAVHHWRLLEACKTAGGDLGTTRSDLASEIEASGLRHVVLSIESLHSGLADTAAVTRLRDLLAPLGDVRVVMQLVRQDRAMTRRWLDGLSRGPVGPHPFVVPGRPEYDFAASAKRWGSVFGDRLILRSQAPTETDRIASFMLAGRLPVDPVRFDPRRPRQELSARAVQTLLEFDRIARATSEEVSTRLVRTVLLSAAEAALPGPRYIAPEQLAREALAPYSDGNRLVARDFLGRSHLFDDDFQGGGACAEAQPLDGIRLAVALASRLIGDHDRLDVVQTDPDRRSTRRDI